MPKDIEVEKTKETLPNLKVFKHSVTEDYKQRTIYNNPEGAWTKSQEGGDIFFHLGHAYKINKTYTQKKTGFLVKYLRCVVDTCSASNKLTDGVLDKSSTLYYFLQSLFNSRFFFSH